MTDPSPIRTIPNNYTHYSPLDSTCKEIRLLHILPANSDDDPLVVALVRTTLADCPKYRALSYCWGNLEDTKTVRVVFRENKNVNSNFQSWHIHEFNREAEFLINETSPTDINASKTAHANFEITSNLYAALKSFRRSWGGINLLWADMLCINQGDVEERSGQVGIMKSIYAIAGSVSVWLGDDEEIAAALFTDDNYALVLFKLALEDAGWKHSDKTLGKFLTQDFPQRVERGEASRQFPAESIQSSAFFKFLSGDGSRTEPISDQEVLGRAGLKRKHDVEIHEQFSEPAKYFLNWLHTPYLQHLAKDPFGLYLPFYKYWERITDPRSDVWQWIEFEIATRLREISPDRLFQPPQNLMQRFSIISSNPWFRRVWVLQEVANNTEVCIYVGTDSVDWIVFQSLLIIVLELVTASSRWGKLPSGDLPPLIWRDVAVKTRSQQLSISRIIMNMGDFSATDPRDMVFAMYPLATDLSGATFKPDYTWSITETYSRFTRWIIDTTSSLDVLLALNVGISTRNGILPSWVPDYDQKIGDSRLMPCVYEDSRASEERQLLVIPTMNPIALRLGGCRVATIAAIIDAKFVDEFIHPNLESREGRQYPKLEEIDIPILWSCLYHAYSTNFSKRLPITQCLEFGKTTPFTVHDFSRVLLHGYTKHADRFADIWAESDPGLAILDCSLDSQQQLRRSIRRRGSLPEPATNNMLREQSLSGQVFFFSHNGELGLCPAGVRSGDEVVVLYGGNLPFVLGPRSFPRNMFLADKLRQSNKYELIGPCYMNGAMKAEKMKSLHWHDPLHHEPLDPDPCIDPSGELYSRGVYRTEFFHIE